MGIRYSCNKKQVIEQPEPLLSASMLFNLHFISVVVPVGENVDPIEKIIHAEDWCLNESIWKTYILNALKEMIPNRKARIHRLKIHTRVNGDIILGNVKWVSNDMNISLFNERIKTNHEEFFEKGIYFIEPYWSTCIVPHLITKTRIITID